MVVFQSGFICMCLSIVCAVSYAAWCELDTCRLHQRDAVTTVRGKSVELQLRSTQPHSSSHTLTESLRGPRVSPRCPKLSQRRDGLKGISVKKNGNRAGKIKKMSWGDGLLRLVD